MGEGWVRTLSSCDEKKMTDNAVVYVAWGDSVKDAIKSVRSLKKHTPDVKSYLFTDVNDAEEFDYIEPIEVYKNRPRTKVEGLLKSCDFVAEENVLYLDADTLVLNDVSDLFSSMDFFDIALAHAPFRNAKMWNKALTAFNSGVIAYRNHTNIVSNLFYDWSKQVIGHNADQYILSKIIHSDDFVARLLVLPCEYNMRTGWISCVQGKVSIIHGKYNLDQVAKVINKRPHTRRVWVPIKGMIYNEK
jgi:hypothetical protein